MDVRLAVICLFCILVAAPCLRAALVLPAVSWHTDNGRLSILLYHGNDERLIITRLSFAAPQTSFLATTANGSTADTLVVMPHTPLALRNDGIAQAATSDAPNPRMARTRIDQRNVPVIMAADIAEDSAAMIADWTSGTRWNAVLFLDTYSDLWRAYACWTLTDIGHALQKLVLEDGTECSTARRHEPSSMHATWAAKPYTYSLPRDGTSRRHGKRGGILTVGAARLTHPAVTSEAEASALGCTPPHCAVARMVAQHRAVSAYPVIIDIESPRNYLPSALHFLCNADASTTSSNGTTALRLEFLDTSLHRAIVLACDHGYSVNADSMEIVLGMPFLKRNFTSFTYDVRTSNVYVTFVPLPPSDALRIVVSLLILVINALVIVWFDARNNYATLVAVVDALDTPAGPSVLPFHAPHVGIELAAIALGALALGLTVGYVDEQFYAYYWTTAVIWITYTAILLAIMIVTLRPVYEAMLRMSRASMAPERFPAHVDYSMISLSTTIVLARHASAMIVLLGGITMALLLSTYTVIMLGVAAAYACLALYYLSYYTSAAVICSGSFSADGRTRIAFSGLPWGGFVVLMGITGLVIFGGTYAALISVIFGELNSFFPAMLLDILSGIILLLVVVFGVYTADNDIFSNIKPKKKPQPSPQDTAAVSKKGQ